MEEEHAQAHPSVLVMHHEIHHVSWHGKNGVMTWSLNAHFIHDVRLLVFYCFHDPPDKTICYIASHSKSHLTCGKP